MSNSDVICRIDWTREDIAKVLEKSGKENVTEEEITHFIENFDWKYLQEKSIQDGFEMLMFGA
ncbi:MAG: hypothetical protein IJ141_05260 [Lachnospiraceae bacterium]|nr:hypothetical protein [Lachnospiraceae bacterium]MBQ9199567.1 hypothetical protein [Lachnospiraceae bacterium]